MLIPNSLALETFFGVGFGNWKFKSIDLPKFDKAIDDRCKKNQWCTLKKRPDVIIFEGWCVGAKAEKNSTLKKSINSLEKSKGDLWPNHPRSLVEQFLIKSGLT